MPKVTARVSGGCSQQALRRGRKGLSGCGAALALTRQGVVVAGIALTAACVGHHVVLRVHGDGDKS